MKRRRSIQHWLHRLQAFWDVRVEYGILGTRPRAYGMDLSRYEPHWYADRAQAGLIDFVFIKATQDTQWKDPAFEQLYIDIQPAAVTGAYHYLSSGFSGTAQAQHFLRTLQGKPFDVLIVDFETYGNTVSDAFVRACYEWLVYVSQAQPTRRVMLYTNLDMYDTALYPAAMRLFGRDVFIEWDLWLAQYPYAVNADGEPALPKNRKDWTFWQFSDAGDPAMHGTDGWCDRNFFNGSLQALLEWAGKGSVTEPTTGGEMSDLFLGTVVAAELNIRRVPTSSNNLPIGKLVSGQKVIAVAKQNGWWKITHINHARVVQESWAYEGTSNGYIRQDDALVYQDTKPVMQISHTLQADGYPDLFLKGEWTPNA